MISCEGQGHLVGSKVTHDVEFRLNGLGGVGSVAYLSTANEESQINLIKSAVFTLPSCYLFPDDYFSRINL